jgi:hypothetical protein
MIRKKTAQQKGIIAFLPLILVVLVLIAVVAYFYLQSSEKVARLEPNPPVSERINVSPASSNFIDSETHLEPGSTVVLDRVVLTTDAYVVVTKDDGKNTLLGKSKKLLSGENMEVSISLNKKTGDGDVLLLSLVDEDNQPLKDDNGNAIQVQKTVGIMMNHYENEY